MLHYISKSPADCGEIIDMLVTCGINVDVQGDTKSTPLHYACFYGNIKTVESLLKHGTDVNIKGHCKRTALHYALHFDRQRRTNKSAFD